MSYLSSMTSTYNMTRLSRYPYKFLVRNDFKERRGTKIIHWLATAFCPLLNSPYDLSYNVYNVLLSEEDVDPGGVRVRGHGDADDGAELGEVLEDVHGRDFVVVLEGQRTRLNTKLPKYKWSHHAYWCSGWRSFPRQHSWLICTIFLCAFRSWGDNWML